MKVGLVTPQDQVALLKRAANVVDMNDLHTLQHELRMAEFDGWNRGWNDANAMSDRFARINEPMFFALGWVLGALLMLEILT